MGGILAFGYFTKAVLLAQLHEAHVAMTAMNEARIREVSSCTMRGSGRATSREERNPRRQCARRNDTVKLCRILLPAAP